jgi:hypothetical protein
MSTGMMLGVTAIALLFIMPIMLLYLLAQV